VKHLQLQMEQLLKSQACLESEQKNLSTTASVRNTIQCMQIETEQRLHCQMKQFQTDLREKLDAKCEKSLVLSIGNKKTDKDEFTDLYRHYLRLSSALDPLIRNSRGLRRLMEKVQEENTMVELGVDVDDRGGLD